MLGSTQLILIIIVSVLSILLLVIGIQLFLILREFQRSIQKANKMLDDFGIVTESVAKPIASFSSSLTNFSGIASFLGWLGKKRKKEKRDE